ncbi:MAG: hypothetical protein ACOVOX_15700 [Burkholderiaceae bacterium]
MRLLNEKLRQPKRALHDPDAGWLTAGSSERGFLGEATLSRVKLIHLYA